MINGWSAVVCGGTAGIGLACADAFLAAGAASVLINGRNSERAERARIHLLEKHTHANVYTVIGDVSRPHIAAQLMQTAGDSMGRIDVLVNSSGGNDIPKLLNEIRIEEIPDIIERCLFAQLLCSHAALPFMRRQGGGAIINVASDAAKVPTPGESIIGAAMAGIVMFTRGLAIEEKRHGIRANVVTPSITTGTDHYARVMADSFAGRMFSKAHERANLGVVAKEDLAGLIAFLASPAAEKITGQAISITGGISAL